MNLDRLARLRHSPEEVAARSKLIHQTILNESPWIKTPQFEAVGVDDLRRLFELYDRYFFEGFFEPLYQRSDNPPIDFRLSDRMTRAAGKTFMSKGRRQIDGRVVELVRFEIAVSSFLLFQSFRDDLGPGGCNRPVAVAGVICSDRLEALLRIFEHELLHLAEFLTLGRSSCSAEPFQTMSRAIFGHEASSHSLITPVERAASVHSINLGDRVAFDHSGSERQGVVGRITKRATVLVLDPSGRLYSDGNHYLSFLVPLDRLRKI